MELRHLRYFVAVAEEGHVTRAATRLGIKQPPLSLQIQKLEEEIGTSLFRRTSRGVELTPAGEAFHADARAILEATARGAARALEIGRGHRGRLAVGFTTSAILHAGVSRAIRGFREAYPDVQVETREGNAAELTAAVAEGALAVAWLRMPVDRPSGLEFIELLREEMLVALPQGHRLCERHSTPLEVTDLDGEPLILVRRPGAAGMYQSLLDRCRAEGFEPRIASEVPYMLSNLGLVAAGVGISIVPASVGDVARSLVHYRPLGGIPPITAPLTLVIRAGPREAVVRNILEIIGGQGSAGR